MPCTRNWKLKRLAKSAVAKAINAEVDAVYEKLDGPEGEKFAIRLAKARHRASLDIRVVKTVKSAEGRVLRKPVEVRERWEEYFKELLNEEFPHCGQGQQFTRCVCDASCTNNKKPMSMVLFVDPESGAVVSPKRVAALSRVLAREKAVKNQSIRTGPTPPTPSPTPGKVKHHSRGPPAARPPHFGPPGITPFLLFRAKRIRRKENSLRVLRARMKRFRAL
ncbi:unnamed protein product [Heligmosomoides polygyrus]|uniref:Uncharacterized protein n=1 Tax=Heligmosomoides polygyrus TaxID=6339 RepID=A0A3P8D4M3_HELPZ|nr:unnamed protein product [Heligmosomoides polygyrus]